MCHHGNFKDHEGPALGSVYSRWLLGNAGVSTTHSWIQDMKLKAEWRAGSVTMVMGRLSYFITLRCPLFVFSLVTVQTFARLDCVKPFHQNLAWQKVRSPAHLGGHEQCFQECGMSLQRTEKDSYVLNIDWAQFMILSVSRFDSARLAQSQVLRSVIIQAVGAHCPPGWAYVLARLRQVQLTVSHKSAACLAADGGTYP